MTFSELISVSLAPKIFITALREQTVIVKKLVLLGFCLVAIPAIADSALPKKMEGKWERVSPSFSNKAEAELIEMTSPTTAKLNVIFWDGCTRRGETTAELKEGMWEFRVPDGPRCNGFAVKVKQLEGKNRFEGVFISPARGDGTVYFEW